jgi:hypothetical protein
MPDTDLQLPDLHYRAKLTVIGLELPPDIDYAQWCEVGRVRTDGCPPATATVDHPADARAEDHRADLMVLDQNMRGKSLSWRDQRHNRQVQLAPVQQLRQIQRTARTQRQPDVRRQGAAF